MSALRQYFTYFDAQREDFMNLSLFLAGRYLLGKKSTNAINIITGISVLGITVGTAALILILSVFNGFRLLMTERLDKFNPDLKIVLKEGKFFERGDVDLGAIRRQEGVVDLTTVIEEVAYFEYQNRQQIGMIKGVDENFLNTTGLGEVVHLGDAKIGLSGDRNLVLLGRGVYNNLNISLANIFTPIKIYLPNRRKRNPLDKDFTSRAFYPGGAFHLENERDGKYILAEYEEVAAMLDLRGYLSAVEIKIDDATYTETIKLKLSDILADDFQIIDRYEQDAAFLKIMNIEKWMSYLIFTFTLILIIFNVIGSLWMIVLDKRKDISILKSMGASSRSIRLIFLYAGLMISLIGAGLGLLFALVFYFIQTQVGIINVPDGYSISSYPMQIELFDVAVIFATVMILGLVASIPACLRAGRVTAYVRTE